MGRERWRLDRQRGVLGPLQAPALLAQRGYTADEMPTITAMRERSFVGTATEVGQGLRRLAGALALDELVVNTWAHDPAARRLSCALLAREFGLATTAATATAAPATAP